MHFELKIHLCDKKLNFEVKIVLCGENFIIEVKTFLVVKIDLEVKMRLRKWKYIFVGKIYKI